MTGLAGRAHQLVTGIGDQRRAGVRHQRDCLACGKTRKQLRPRFGGIVLVIGRERRRDAVAFGELAGDAGVLAGDDVGAGEQFERAQGDVAQISDRCRHQIEAGGNLGRPQSQCRNGA